MKTFKEFLTEARIGADMNSQSVIRVINGMMNDVDRDEKAYLTMLASRIEQTFPDVITSNDIADLSRSEPQVKRLAKKIDWVDLMYDVIQMV